MQFAFLDKEHGIAEWFVCGSNVGDKNHKAYVFIAAFSVVHALLVFTPGRKSQFDTATQFDKYLHSAIVPSSSDGR